MDLTVPHELGIVDGHRDQTVVATLTNRSFGSIELLPENTCCVLSSAEPTVLGPFVSKDISFTVSTHKFPLGHGNTDLVVPYRSGGVLRAATAKVWYEVRR